MKLREIFRFELGYQLRRVQTWLFCVVLGVITFVAIEPNFIEGARDGDYLLNAPYVVAAGHVIGSVLWMLGAVAVAGEAAARDVVTGMHPLMYTAPVRKADYLGGRFLAALVLNALMLLAVPAGIVLGTYAWGLEAGLLGPFRPAAYLAAFGIIALPNAFVVTAIQFSFAALSRRTVASYIGGPLLLVIAYLGARFLKPEVGQLLDPVGVISIVDYLTAWTTIEKNTRLMGLEGWVLANRLLWLGIALGTLAFTYLRFRFGHPAEGARRKHVTRREDAHSPTPTAISIPSVRGTFGFATRARQTLAIAWRSFGKIAASRSGLILLALVALLSVLSAEEALSQNGVPLIPRTDFVLHNLIFPPIPPAWLIIPLLIVFWAGELVWREREAGISEIVDAAPVPEWVLFLGKFLGLGLLIVACLTLRMAAGLFAQAGMGHNDLQIGLYLKILFGLQLADYLFVALLALVVHVLVNQRHAGHLVALIACGFQLYAAGNEVGHHLLVYGSSPGWTVTDMRGFGSSLGPWLWFKLYWAAWALLVAVVARLLWVRGREGGLRARLQTARRRFTRPTATVAAVAAGLILTLGGFIFYNTNVLNEYETAADGMERRAEYERRYGQYEGIPQPRLTGTNLHVEIYPERREVQIRGTYQLVNGSSVAIDSVHLATVPSVETTGVEFDRPAALVLADDALGHQIYSLDTPLQPGDSLQLGFEVRFDPRGFRNDGVDYAVVANGTYFTNQDWLPAIGYQPMRELRDAGDRQVHGLAPQPAIPSLDGAQAHQLMYGAERIAFEAVVGTDEDQVAVAPGALRRTWTEGGRRYFHYVADAPIGNEVAFFSAGYAVHEARWNDVAIQIYHHPGHTANLEHMVRSVQVSLSHFTEQFGPYPYSWIRLIERPGHGSGLHADSGMISYGEGFSLWNPAADPRDLDLVFAIVAHEVGHQFQPRVAVVEGGGVLSESFAWYAALGAVREGYGGDHLGRLLDWMHQPDPHAPVRAAVPLLRANNDYLNYRRGPFALYALSEFVGADKVNAAFRRLREGYASAAGPGATTLDLYRELQAEMPESFQYLVHDLFAANTLWELETEQATAVETEAGVWQVTLAVGARKVVVDEAGVETEVPMDDWVEIGVFGAAGDEPIYAQKHRIRSGQQMITVTVPQRPARAGIDPFNLLIDLETGENTVDVKVES